MNQALLIALGGASGALARYAMVGACNHFWPVQFPLGTLLVNVLGCFLIGYIYAAFSQHVSFESWIKPLFIIGLLGGFTTFSSFSYELLNLSLNAQLAKAALYLMLSNIMGFAAALAGYKLLAV